ncbi:arylsulfatase [Ravibacter arvi]|uniref:Arylsulfatase n=1 Tax=Ravibacter arvi TaxID=2051041 RepID=A0ABP8LMP1_9BACT
MKHLLILAGIFGMMDVYSQSGKPGHVIIIMADQLRADVLGAQTPNIETLRKDAVTFTRAYCASPLCAPSRASFFTGLYPNRTGSMINPWSKEDEIYGTVKAGIPSLYTIMENSWDSRHVGKQHFFTAEKIDRSAAAGTKWVTQEDYSSWMSTQKKDKPGGKRFKAEAPELVSGKFTRLRSYSTPRTELYKEGIDYFLDRYITDESIRSIREWDKSRPLLLNTMYLAPHPPFHIPEPYFSMYQPGGFHLPENVGRWYPGQSPLQMYSLTGFIGSRYTREQWDNTWAKYLGLVKLLDDEVGRLIKALREEGLYDSALIIFTSDHGEMLGSHSLWQKMCMYEESVRVPLMVKLPKEYPVKNRNITTPVSLVDVLPTILDLNGTAASPGQTDGKSLVPLLAGSDKERDAVFIQYDGNGSLGSAQRCLVDGDFKLIVDTFREETFLEMYDMKRDPQETQNLALNRENERLLNQLMTKLQNRMDGSGDRIRFGDDIVKRFHENYAGREPELTVPSGANREGGSDKARKQTTKTN